jgi:hypothetical protein
MTFQSEVVRKNEGNSTFKNNFVLTLQKAVRDVPNLLVLDYGSGKDHFRTTTAFSDLKHGQVTVAYEPTLDRNSEHVLRNGNKTIWSKEEPKGREFDLVICNFSLHHMEEPLKTLSGLRDFEPKFIAVSEYDFKEATINEFKNGFQGDFEQRELRVHFEGNWQRCLDFHQRVGEEEVRQGLEQSGYSILKHKRGEGTAQNKFFMIGWITIEIIT